MGKSSYDLPILILFAMRPYQLTLLLTELCNLRCSYCHCDKKFLASMRPQTAHKAIDEVMEARPAEEPLNILLMGGEPFLAFPLIQDVVDYTCGNYPSKKVLFKAVSNGTLIHGNIQQWLLEHRNLFEVTLSLDGDKETHNRNRCGSFDLIDFDFFTKRYGRHTTVSSVVVPETLDKLAANVMAMEEQGFGIKFALADGIAWDVQQDAPRLAAQLDLLIEHYLQHPQLQPMNLLSYAIWCVPGHFAPERCVPLTWSHCVAPDGKTHACHRSTPYYNSGEWSIPEEKISLRGVGFLKPACATCCVRSICNACPATVAALQGHPLQTEITCALNKVLYVANAKLVVRMFLECPTHIHITRRPASMQIDMLQGAQTILEQLQ